MRNVLWHIDNILKDSIINIMKYYVSIFLAFLCFTGCCQENTSLNDFTISEIFIPKDDNNFITLELNKDIDYLDYIYKDFKILIFYYKKNGIFNENSVDEINIREMKLIEQYNNGEFEGKPNIGWLQNIRKNIINEKEYVDSFIFCSHEYTIKQLRRIVFITTNDFYIRIIITPNLSDIESEELFDEIYEETPQYFKYTPITTIDGKNVIGWVDRDSI